MNNMKNKKKIQIVFSMCLLIAGMLLFSATCKAAETGSIQIEYRGITEKDEEVMLDHAEFVYYYVGNMQDGTWKTTGDFEKSGVSLEDETSSERAYQAEHLYEYARKKELRGNVVETDYRGIARITDLKEGIYLIAQTEDWKRKEAGAFRSAPFLISVPIRINDKAIWKVVCKPKSEWISDEGQEQLKPTPEEEATKPDKPKTGDSAPIELIMIAMIMSLCLMLYIGTKNQDEQLENKNE